MRLPILLLSAFLLAGMSSPPKPPPTPPGPDLIPRTTKADKALPPPESKDPVAAPVTPATKSLGSLKPVDRDALLKTFAGYVGIKESPMGSNNGPLINKFNASCGLKPSDHAPWCAAVAHYGYEVNGADDRPGAYSPSWFQKKRVIPGNQVEPGDVGLVYFPSKGRYAHTIAAIEKVARVRGVVTTVTTLEGNTNAQGSREGDQFARRSRAADTLVFVRFWPR